MQRHLLAGLYRPATDVLAVLVGVVTDVHRFGLGQLDRIGHECMQSVILQRQKAIEALAGKFFFQQATYLTHQDVAPPT